MLVCAQVTHDFAHRVISALRATNDIIEVDNKLHLRPGAVIGAPPPLLGPPGAPLHTWIVMPPPAAPADDAARALHQQDEVQARMTAAAQAQQQRQAYHTYFTSQVRPPLGDAHAARAADPLLAAFLSLFPI
eukprot:scaffold12088_cov98-Isochrysis_galbana.AAC.2